MQKRLIYIFSLLYYCYGATAQDAQFSQYYANPIYHNPAFAGAAHAPRLIANYRNQWAGLGANFVTTSFSADNYFEKLNSGVAISLLSDSQGASRLKTTEVSGQYAYQLQLGEYSALRLGLQATYLTKRLDNSNLTFGDQFDPTGRGMINNSSTDPLSNSALNAVQTVDFSTGALYYSEKLWLGLAVNHLTHPQISFTNTFPSKLYTKWTVSGGYSIPLNNPFSTGSRSEREFTATPTFLIKQQGKSLQADLGFYLTYSPLTLGAWYRGIPIKKNGSSTLNHDALVLLAGYRLDKLSIGYSYDFTISKLGPSTGGTHEISIAYILDPIESDRPHRRFNKKALSCPKF